MALFLSLLLPAIEPVPGEYLLLTASLLSGEVRLLLGLERCLPAAAGKAVEPLLPTLIVNGARAVARLDCISVLGL